MITKLLFFVLLVVAWVAALWFGIAPDFARWGIPAMAAVHVLPPLVVIVASLAVSRWRRQRAQVAAAEREKIAAEEAAAKQAAARAQHDAEIARLQRYCECRAVALAQVSRHTLAPENFGLDDVDLPLSEWDEDGIDPEVPMLEHLRPAITEALSGIFTTVSAAARFPIYLVPPAEVVGEALFATVREIHAALIDELGLAADMPPPACYFLSTGDSVANSLVSLFENTPELFGAIVLALDSPRLRAGDEDEAIAEALEQQKWHGQPGQGVFALLVTTPGLVESLAAVTGNDAHLGQTDALTPYWELQTDYAGPGVLQAMTAPEREQLAETPVIARIHRAQTVSLAGLHNRSRETVLAIQPALEKSRLCARLLDAPFQCGEALPDTEETIDPLACGWLVHNAGGVDRSGHRLATLGLALINQGLEVDPIHAATNLVAQAGDLGQARSVGLLAMTVVRAAASGAAALAAEYHGDDHLSLYFAVAEPS